MHEDHCREVRFVAGSYLVRAGEVSDDIFVLTAGKAELLRNNPDGREQTIELLEAGRVFGEMEFIMEEPRTYSVRALTDLTVKIISPRVFSELYESEIGQIVRPILQSWSERLRGSLLRLAEIERAQNVYRPLPEEHPEAFTVTLYPCTPRASEALNGMESLNIVKFPLYVGRYSRRRSDDLFHANNLFLYDQMPYSISRSHFSLVLINNEIIFYDRGSTLGSIVNDLHVGGKPDAPKKINLRIGENTIILGGTEKSKLVFGIRIVRNSNLPKE